MADFELRPEQLLEQARTIADELVRDRTWQKGIWLRSQLPTGSGHAWRRRCWAIIGRDTGQAAALLRVYSRLRDSVDGLPALPDELARLNAAELELVRQQDLQRARNLWRWLCQWWGAKNSLAEDARSVATRDRIARFLATHHHRHMRAQLDPDWGAQNGPDYARAPTERTEEE